jgi:hypothetical protein
MRILDVSGFSIEDVQIAFIKKETVSSSAAGLPQDASLDHANHRGGSGRKANVHLAGSVLDREERVSLSISIDQ